MTTIVKDEDWYLRKKRSLAGQLRKANLIYERNLKRGILSQKEKDKLQQDITKQQNLVYAFNYELDMFYLPKVQAREGYESWGGFA